MDAQTLFYVLYGLLFIFIIVFVVTGKWIKFALQAAFYKKKWGEGNVGLIFTRSMGNNFGIPTFLHLNDTVKQTDETTNVYQREQFTEGLFYGLPYLFADAHDTKTSYGLYKAQCLDNGEPAYHKIATSEKDTATGNQIFIQTKIPVLDKVKSSVTLDPGLVRKAVVNMALSEAINEFIKKHKILLMAVGGACLLAGIAAFFGYNNQNALSNLCVANLPAWKSQIIDACTTALKNSTVVKS